MTATPRFLDWIREHYGTVGDDLADRVADWIDFTFDEPGTSTPHQVVSDTIRHNDIPTGNLRAPEPNSADSDAEPDVMPNPQPSRTASSPMTPPEPPEIMYDYDGAPIAVRGDIARSPAAAVRHVTEDNDWWLDGLLFPEYDDNGRPQYNIPKLLNFVRTIKPGWMRPAETDADFGWDTWYWCPQTHPNAVPYWQLDPTP